MQTLDSLVNYAALGVAVWLGLYIATRSHRRLAWLAVGTLWALAGYFLNRVVNLDFPEYISAAQLGAASVTLASPLWYHLSTEFYPRALGRRLLIPLGYGVALLFGVLILRTNLLFGSGGSVPNVLASHAGVGPLYPAYGAFLIVWPLLGVWNFSQAWRTSPPALRGQLAAILWATGVGVAGALYLVVALALRLNVPNLVGDVALGVSVALVGYAVARYNAVLEGHAASADFIYAAVWMGLVVTGYLVVTWTAYRLYGIPPSTYVFLFVLVITSHTLSDWFRSRIDRLFYRRTAARLRETLRALAGEVGSLDSLGSALHAVLAEAGASLGAERGLVAVRRDETLTVLASLRAGPTDRPLADFPIPDEAVCLAQPPAEWDDLAAVAPLLWAGETLGCVIVGRRAGEYTPEELLVLADIGDRLAGVVYAARASEAATAELNAQIERFRAREDELQRQLQTLTTPTAGEFNEAVVTRWVEDGLRHLHDFSYLGEHSLADTPVVRAALQEREPSLTVLERGQAVRDVLLRTLEQLRPPGAEPKGDSAAGHREWHAYLILRGSYVEDVPNREVMNRLYISEGTYNRTRRQALRGLARALLDQGRRVEPGQAGTIG